ncbi:winged helix-turn-helix domain-containing protein [Phenylobacterium koreense]|uniref:OmpR/PhoB-type domain-containing protein n=1 Tax=Phenylobacterium koreense TaxID=266125 RepID=A0ABV2ENB1_9CAUL
MEIGSRAFDLLHILLRARGRVVARADLFRHVWPMTTVDDSNLRFQISCLRRALGKDRELLKTVPGRGYMLAAEVTVQSPSVAYPAAAEAVAALARPVDDAGDPERLRGLLRSVLDELWAMSREAREAGAPPQASDKRAGEAPVQVGAPRNKARPPQASYPDRNATESVL